MALYLGEGTQQNALPYELFMYNVPPNIVLPSADCSTTETQSTTDNTNTINVTVEQFPKMCRSCLTTEDVNFIFQLQYEGLSFNQIFETCTSIQINEDDELPQNICLLCVKKVVRCYKFIKKAQEHDKMLRSVLREHLEQKQESSEEITIIKQEINDPNDSNEVYVAQNELLNDFEVLKTENGQVQIYIKSETHLQPPENPNEQTQSTVNVKTTARKCPKNLRRTYTCTTCSQTFSAFKNLVEHHKTTGHVRGKHFNCPTCDKAYYTNETLKKHMKTHLTERPHVCHVCGAQFQWAQVLRNHVRIHTGERPHVCKVCGKDPTMPEPNAQLSRESRARKKPTQSKPPPKTGKGRVQERRARLKVPAQLQDDQPQSTSASVNQLAPQFGTSTDYNDDILRSMLTQPICKIEELQVDGTDQAIVVGADVHHENSSQHLQNDPATSLTRRRKKKKHFKNYTSKKSNAKRAREYYQRKKKALRNAATQLQDGQSQSTSASVNRDAPQPRAIKSSAQRCREYRQRKKSLRIAAAQLQDASQPRTIKSSAQRSREYRQRKKAMENANAIVIETSAEPAVTATSSIDELIEIELV